MGDRPALEMLGDPVEPLGVFIEQHPPIRLGPFPDDASLVRTRVVPNLIAGYYASPAGWAVVGYDVFPGRCGDLARYTGPGA